MSKPNSTALPGRCERCGLRAWDDLYSSDGLGGHEILICSSCRRELELAVPCQEPERSALVDGGGA